MRCNPIEGRFPDAEYVLPKTPAPVSFRIDADLFCVLLKAAGDLARQDGGRAIVDVLCWGFDKPIGVTSKGPDEVYFDGLAMPLT